VISEVLRWVRLVIIAYAVIVLLLALFQRRLIYFPTRDSEEGVLAHAREAGLQPWRDQSGALIGFFRPAGNGAGTGADTGTGKDTDTDAETDPDMGTDTRMGPDPDADAGTDPDMGVDAGEDRGLGVGVDAGEAREPGRVLVFHGNAGFAAHRGYFSRLFPDRAVYILEYPGFGSRPGSPGESTIRTAVDDALAELMRMRPDPVVVLGESIGSGPAAWLAGTHPEAVAGLLLITPFASLADVAAAQFPFFPVRWVLQDRWENERFLASYPGPVAFLIAGEDTIVPPRFGRALYEGYLAKSGPGSDRSERDPGRMWTVPGTGHNEIIRDLPRQTWREIRRYLEGSPD
jgi:uncharacterized protein